MKIISGFRVNYLFFKIQCKLLIYILFNFGLTTKSLKKIKEIKLFKEQFTIKKSFYKFVKHNNRIYLNCNIPGIPFPDFYKRITNLASTSEENSFSNLAIVQIGFTKKCPLNCEHCYEGKVLNQPETVTLAQHKEIVSKLQEYGVPMIQFGGGEPLNRFHDLIDVLYSSSNSSDFWIYSSGYGLTLEKAKELKKAGLTGISISLDHFEKEKHNNFRKNQKSFDYAIEAIKHAQEAGLMTAMTICITKSFCTYENLNAYHLLAHSLNVPFVQLMEPRAVGNFEGKNVSLEETHYQILEDFYISRNSEKKYKNLPIIQYTGYQQRKKSCGGAAKRYIYIDTDGKVMACPFCENRKSFFLDPNLEKNLNELKQAGCGLLKDIQK